MTFATRLEELRKDATEGEWHASRNTSTASLYVFDGDYISFDLSPENAELITHLVNHSADILALVKAAEEVAQTFGHLQEPSLEQLNAICDCVAKLNQE